MFVVGGILLLLVCCSRNVASNDSLELVKLIPYGLTSDFSVCEKYPRLHLNTSLMMSLLNAKMSSYSSVLFYSSAYIAATEADAEDDFVNMIPVTNNWVDGPVVFGRTTGEHQLLGQPLAKRHIKRALSLSQQQNSRRRHVRDIGSSLENAGTSYVLPEELGVPASITHPSGGTSSIEYCRAQGESTGGYLLPLCSMCAMTTRLPDTYFPPWINEVYCNGSDPRRGNGCLHLQGLDNGSCQQTTIWFNILEAVPTKCEVITVLDASTQLELHQSKQSSKNNQTNGQWNVPSNWHEKTYWVEGWDITPHPMNTGCECMLHQDSFLTDMFEENQ